MDINIFSLYGIFFIFFLGLRHGIDPDHIAIVDSMTFRLNEQKSSVSRWTGTLFALGHGSVVTIIACAVALLSKKFELAQFLTVTGGWLPVFLLILVGTLNLKELLSTEHYAIVGWKTKLLPKKFRNSNKPVSIFFIGVIFALVFDTATQAAAWGYAVSAEMGLLGAFLIGIVFTFGMVISDSLDCNLVYFLLKRNDNKEKINIYRRTIGWFTVISSYGIALYGIIKYFLPAFEVHENSYTILGFTMVIFVLLVYILSLKYKPVEKLENL